MKSVLTIIFVCIASAADAQVQERRAPAWSVPLYDGGEMRRQALPEPLSYRIITQTVRLNATGRLLRVRLNNRYGDRPLRVDAVTVGLFDGEPSTNSRFEPITFNRQKALTIAVGAVALSDAAAIRVRTGARLSIRLFVSHDAPRPSLNLDGARTAAISARVADRAFNSPNATEKSVEATLFVDRVDVLSHRPSPKQVIIVGDSITAGAGTPIDADRRWTDQLQERLGPRWTVLNAGINGGTLIWPSRCFGPVGSQRARQAIGQRGVEAVIVMLGVNDLMQPRVPANPGGCTVPGALSTLQITRELSTLQMIARRNHVRLFVATLPPFAGFELWNPEIEAQRLEVNRWLHRSVSASRIIDVAGGLGSPENSARLRTQFDSGDGLHPSELGAGEISSVAADGLAGLPERAKSHAHLQTLRR